MLITVAINLYNYEKYIKDCIQSVLNQTYKNLELIVVDDCSTDKSGKIAKQFEKIDNRVRVITLQKNYGIGHAKNEGICASKGQYIATLDADDMLTKDSLELRLNAILKYNVSIVYADAIIFKQMGLNEVYKLKNIPVKLKGCPRRKNSIDVYNIHAQTVLVDREVYKKYGLYDEDLGCKVDREMWLRLFGKDENDISKVTSFHLEECVAYSRLHSTQVTKRKSKDKKFGEKNIKLCEKKYQIRKISIDRNNTRFLEE